MKIQWNPDKWNKSHQMILLVSLAILLLVVPISKALKLNRNHRWTIATTSGWGYGRYINYYFFVDGKKYEKSNKTLSLIPSGGRYWVQFEPNNPDLNSIRTSEIVPDCISEVPSNGWEEKPSCQDSIP
jgi:hypothetical protein